MSVTPLVYLYTNAEIAQAKNKLHFCRGPKSNVWELNANKVYVYKYSNLVQVIGEWYEVGSPSEVIGVLNIRLNDIAMYKARSNNLSAPEITSLIWDDWFIYRIDRGEDNGTNPFNNRKARQPRFRTI